MIINSNSVLSMAIPFYLFFFSFFWAESISGIGAFFPWGGGGQSEDQKLFFALRVPVGAFGGWQ